MIYDCSRPARVNVCSMVYQSTIRNQQSSMACIRVLGVDTSLRSTGVALVQARGAAYETLEYQLVKNPAGRPLSACLEHLSRAISEIVACGKPQAAALEGIFFCKNVKTAVILGEARGVVIAACACAGVPVYEYSPRRVKQAVVGWGNADKLQVRKMVMSILKLNEEPHEDASDALAIALCHLHTTGRLAGLTAKEI
jgi:crossover junction endodeoxyribonuclease RuvC